jgi:hypothetical protein
MYEWLTGNAHTMVVTLYNTNITLNNSAAAYFSDVRYATIGINRDLKQFVIKPVTKREVDLKIVQLEHLHKVSIGKGYARISNKIVCDELASIINENLEGQKYIARYDDKEKMLVINLSDESE